MVAPPVPTLVTPVQGATVTTSTPELTANLGADSDGNKVRAEWQAARDNAFTNSVVTLSESTIDLRTSGTTRQFILNTTPLDQGRWYLRCRSIDSTNTASAYSSTTSFDVSLAAIARPTEVSPSNNAVISTSTPLISAFISPASEDRLTGAQWQFARDEAFAVDVRLFTTSVDEQIKTGTIIHKADNELTQGIWFVRARAYSSASFSAWTDTAKFIVFHQPSAVPEGGATGLTLPVGQSVVLSWDFSDPSITDSQSAYQLTIERNEERTLVLDTSKIGKPDQTYTVPIQLIKDTVLRWRVRVWDEDDVAGPWSPYGVFVVADPPVVNIISPVSGSTISTGAPNVRWTMTASNGRIQKFYQVIIKNQNTGEIIVDTGQVESSDTTYVPPQLASGITWNLSIFVTDSSGLSSI